MSAPATIFFTADGETLPASLLAWLDREGCSPVMVRNADELIRVALRGRPRVVIFDARSADRSALDACRRLKRDSYTGVVPSLAIVTSGQSAVARAFDAGAR